MTKKVSVILTNFNHAKYVAEALDSIKNQTYKNLELIVIDDHSTDNSHEVVEAWDKANPGLVSLLLWEQENKGKWSVLNKAISQASGELITLQDADDVSCPERIERQVKALEATGTWHNLCGFFHCYTPQDMDKNRTYKAPPAYSLPVMNPKEVLRLVHEGYKTPGVNHYYTGSFETHGATSMFYRQLWQNGMKFLPGNLGLRVQRAEDSDHNTRLTLLLQKTSVLLEPQYCYRRNTSTNGAWLEGL